MAESVGSINLLPVLRDVHAGGCGMLMLAGLMAFGVLGFLETLLKTRGPPRDVLPTESDCIQRSLSNSGITC